LLHMIIVQLVGHSVNQRLEFSVFWQISGYTAERNLNLNGMWIKLVV